MPNILPYLIFVAVIGGLLWWILSRSLAPLPPPKKPKE